MRCVCCLNGKGILEDESVVDIRGVRTERMINCSNAYTWAKLHFSLSGKFSLSLDAEKERNAESHQMHTSCVAEVAMQRKAAR